MGLVLMCTSLWYPMVYALLIYFQTFTNKQNANLNLNCDKTPNGYKTKIVTKLKLMPGFCWEQLNNLMRCTQGSLLWSRNILSTTILNTDAVIFSQLHLLEERHENCRGPDPGILHEFFLPLSTIPIHKRLEILNSTSRRFWLVKNWWKVKQ